MELAIFFDQKSFSITNVNLTHSVKKATNVKELIMLVLLFRDLLSIVEVIHPTHYCLHYVVHINIIIWDFNTGGYFWDWRNWIIT